jgi:hypothetical protein
MSGRVRISTFLVRLLLAAGLLAGMAFSSPTRAAQPAHALTVIPGEIPPVPGVLPPTIPSISHLNTATAHYTTDTTGLVRVQLYTSPVAINPGPPARDTWQFRTITLTPAGATLVSPPSLPFHLSVSSATPEADLISEDGVDLRLGLATINGAAPALQTGRPGPTSITCPAGAAGQPSVTFRPTISGMDLRVTLPAPVPTGSVTLTLTATTVQAGMLAHTVQGIDPSAPVQFVQQPTGTISIQRPQQVCGRQGCQTLTAPRSPSSRPKSTTVPQVHSPQSSQVPPASN